MESDVMNQLKASRKSFKGAMTRKMNRMKDLMTREPSPENVQEIYRLEEQLDVTLASLRKAHEDYQACLSDPATIEESFQYFDEYLIQYYNFKQQLNTWLADIVQPTDSISNVSPKAASKASTNASTNASSNVSTKVSMKVSTKVSSKSTASSTSRSSVRQEKMKVSAKRAALMVEVESLSKKYALAEEKLQLRLREERLKLETKMEKAKAQEQVYENYEEELQDIPSVIQRQSAYHLPSTIQERLTSSTIPHPRTTVPTPVSQKVIFKTSPCMNSSMLEESLPNKFAPNPHPKQERLQATDFDDDGYKVLQSLQIVQKQVERQLKAQRLPKADLISFDGNPLNYFLFIKSFENNVEKCTDDASERLQLLIQYCTGKAKDIVKGCGMMDAEEGYKTAKRLLERRFGDNYLVSNAWINKVADGPVIAASDRESLQDLADDLENCEIVLRVAGRLHEINNDDKLIKILRRVPSYLRSRWQTKARELRDHGKVPNVVHVKELIANAAKEKNDPVFGEILDRNPMDRRSSKPASTSERKIHKGHTFTTQTDDTVAVTESNSRWKCFHCQGNHRLNDCKVFDNLPSNEKLQFVRKRKLCENCLSTTHFAGGCKIPNDCKVQDCTFSRKHMASLHPALLALRQREQSSSSSTDSNSNGIKNSTNQNRNNSGGFMGSLNSSARECDAKALPIVPVKVKGKGNTKVVQVYALLDTGSTSTWCSSRLLQQLDVNGSDVEFALTTIEKRDVPITAKKVSLEVMDMDENAMIELSDVYAREELHVSSSYIASQQDVNRWPNLNGVRLTNISAEVELLIGQDVPAALEPIEVRRSVNGGPFASRTCLGWTLNGPLGRNGLTKKSKKQVFFSKLDESLDEQFNRFVNLEFVDSIACDNRVMSQDDRRVMKIYDESARIIDGHYQFAIPWKCNPPDLPNNKPLAKHRLRLLQKRLVKDELLHKKYSTFISDLLQRNYARKVPDDVLGRDDGKVWYLPHHSVVHPQKPDKVRIVFDCAAKYSGVSLNDKVYQGPDLTSKLVGVLTRFREEPFCLMSDVESMYHQVRVDPDDIDALRFLWFPNNDVTQDPVEYQMCVHLFGGVWSASCANYALLRTAADNAKNFAVQTVETVKNNFYVDDCLKSVTSEESAISLAQDLTSLLKCGGFHLTKWSSNSKNVINSIPLIERAKEVKDLDLYQDELPVERALGVRWDMESDKFIYQIKIKDKPATRRGILSTISSVYDPMGFVCPYILSAKSILRDLCYLGWDDAIPYLQLTRWNNWLYDLPNLKKFCLDRCFKPLNFGEIVNSQLHHFADASECGYAAVSYIRHENRSGDINCAFILSKSRIAPLKQLSIPRLELSAATVAVRLDKLLKREIDIKLKESVFWTDSTSVLGYIDNQDKRYQTFVANRLSCIHDVSSPKQWKHVDSKTNPADIASRGATVDKLLSDEKWLHGPEFLRKPECDWPVQPVERKISSDDPELKTKTVLHAEVSGHGGLADLGGLFRRFSSWVKLKKSIAWILRYKNWLIQRVKMKSGQVNLQVVRSGRITLDEMRSAERIIISFVQWQHFAGEMNSVAEKSSTRSIKKSSPICNLDPFISGGLLRVGGRLKNADLDFEAQHPIILPKNHPIVDLIIRHFHLLSGHSGREHVLSLIREHFWIINGRASVRRILRSCFLCKRLNSRPMKQKMADLPPDRVTADKPPFTFTGIDCFGPFTVKRGRVTVKRYGVIFTCLTTRAIHIEVAYSLDTSSFINSLRRFICRRGMPEEIRSDNGGNFVGGEREIRQEINQWNQEQLQEFMLQRNIRWLFNPPFASHMGGVWERCIRTVRKVLSALVKEQVLDDEGLSTLMCEVESIVNSRPLTHVSDDPKDLDALTPNHLLLLRKGPRLPPGNFNRNDLYSVRRWRQVQYMSDVFWRRWIKEYLTSLQQRNKWKKPTRNVSVGDLVLLIDYSIPRLSWPLARIVELTPNSDGLIRQVKLKTKTTTLTRPIHKLCLLEDI